MPRSDEPLCDAGAWAIIKSFAQIDDAALSVVKNKLKDHLGMHYKFDDWKPAFNSVLWAKDDSDVALAAVNNLEIDTLHKFRLSDAPVDNFTLTSFPLSKTHILLPFLQKMWIVEIECDPCQMSLPHGHLTIDFCSYQYEQSRYSMDRLYNLKTC